MISRLPRPTRIIPAPKPSAPAPATPLPSIPVEDIEYDEDGRRILTAPLATPFRRVPTRFLPPGLRGLPRPSQPKPKLSMEEARAKAGGVLPRPVVTPKPVAPKPVRALTFTAADVPIEPIRRTYR